MCVNAPIAGVFFEMSDERANFTKLASEATRQSQELSETLMKLRAAGHEVFAKALVSDILNDIEAPEATTEPKEATPEPELTKQAGPQGENKPDNSHLRTRQSTPQPLGIDGRIFPIRLKTVRHLRSKLLNDIILIYIASNKANVTSQDIQDELKHLNLGEPKGTTLSRISRLRSMQLLKTIEETSSGIYETTEQGVAAARAAIAEYGLQITI